MRFLTVVWILGLSLSARAEYRVFELAIADSVTGQTRMVVTTLDDRQYRGYFPLKISETITIRATWKCWERADYFKSFCPNPKTTKSPT